MNGAVEVVEEPVSTQTQSKAVHLLSARQALRPTHLRLVTVDWFSEDVRHGASPERSAPAGYFVVPWGGADPQRDVIQADRPIPTLYDVELLGELRRSHTRRTMTESEVEELAELGDDWDGEGAPAPTADALDRVRSLLGPIFAEGLEPTLAEADVNGGAGFWFDAQATDQETGLHRAAWLVCQNGGRNLAVLNAKRTDKRGGVFDLAINDPAQLRADLARVRAFLRYEG